MSIWGPLVNLPNKTLEKQKYYQNNHNALYLRGPRAKLYVGTFTALFAAGMASTLFASFTLVAGKPSSD
ncbi:hypothetical protein BDQ17DRAFT_1423604 [Cyathus striatus]|nr:hypothetical protein BDQ17DRAFT_1423604 [Cyathus striatus]